MPRLPLKPQRNQRDRLALNDQLLEENYSKEKSLLQAGFEHYLIYENFAQLIQEHEME